MRISDWSSDVCSSDLPFLRHVAVIGLDVEAEQHAVLIARLARVEVDRARQPALDHLDGGVLVDLDRTAQFGRHVGEVYRLTVVAGRAGIKAVEFGSDEAPPADDDASSEATSLRQECAR